MDIKGSLQRLFTKRRITKAPELSHFTIKHDAIDEFILDDMRRDAQVLDETMRRVPEIEITHEDGTTERKRIESAGDLYSDTFFAYHDRHDVPAVLPQHEVAPSRDLFRQVMQAMIEHQDFKATRPYTRDDRIGASLATIRAQEVLEEELGTTLKEHAERHAAMEEHQQTMGDNERLLEELREKIRELIEAGSTVPEDLKEQIRNLAKEKADARAQLGDLSQQQQGGLSIACGRAVDRMAEAGQEAAEGWANLPGNGPGSHLVMRPDQAINIAQQWMKHDWARKVAELMGRLERDFRFKASNRVVSGREIPVDVELGDDLPHMLRSELVLAAVPQLRGLFYKKYLDKGLLQYEMVGTAPAGKGPFILVLDFSGSMKTGEKHIWAKAVALALLTIAHREKRSVYIIACDTKILGEWEFPAKGQVDLERALEFACLSPSGGTQLYPALQRAEQIMEQSPQFRQADIVLATDGESSFAGGAYKMNDDGSYVTDDDGNPMMEGCLDLELRQRMNAKGVRIHGISILHPATAYLNLLCEQVIPVKDMTGPSEATDHLVQAVI